MENKLKNCIYCDNAKEMEDLLKDGLNPNYNGGWPIRLAARHGSFSVVRTLLQFGANPHLLSESGASTLQLAIYSKANWDSDEWTFLLSFCDSSQLADGAAVAIIFNNIPALMKILKTGRLNLNIPTTLTGKTVETLAKGYKLQYLLDAVPATESNTNVSPNQSPRNARLSRQLRPSCETSLNPPQHPQRNLSPSVARFFHQTAGQTGLTPPRSTILHVSSPPTPYARTSRSPGESECRRARV